MESVLLHFRAGNESFDDENEMCLFLFVTHTVVVVVFLLLVICVLPADVLTKVIGLIHK